MKTHKHRARKLVQSTASFEKALLVIMSKVFWGGVSCEVWSAHALHPTLQTLGAAQPHRVANVMHIHFSYCSSYSRHGT